MIIREISSSTALGADYLKKIVRSASHRYKVYPIRKRTGGFREISQPSVELKLLQRWLVDNVFSYFPVHESVYSYRKGLGIKNIAGLHKNKRYLLRVDFADFFPSVKGVDVSNLVRKRAALVPIRISEKDVKIIEAIVCKDGHLTIGAPSSPAITNAILYDFDRNFCEKARSKGALYSRYADDIYLSSNRKGVLSSLYRELRKDLKRLRRPRLTINEEKTVFSSRKHTRIVTGLYLTSDRKISIGRRKKRFIKGMVHRYLEGKLDEKQIAYLRGFLSYVKGVEPNFLTRLRKKFGRKKIDEILKAEIVCRKENK